MSGIWDRIIPGPDRVSVHQLYASLSLAVDGTFTNQQIINDLNSDLVTPLDAAAVADLAAIKSAIDGITGVANKLNRLRIFDSLNMKAEKGTGNLTEAIYRNKLGL